MVFVIFFGVWEPSSTRRRNRSNGIHRLKQIYERLHISLQVVLIAAGAEERLYAVMRLQQVLVILRCRHDSTVDETLTEDNHRFVCLLQVEGTVNLKAMRAGVMLESEQGKLVPKERAVQESIMY